jgi:Fungal N-terminal domain of STAND proteins
MEVVAAVSSIAGIASLVGQSLSGLSSLFNFFKDCRDASKTADHFLRSLTSLESTIKDVESLVTLVKNIPDTSAECTLASLAIHVEDCTKDIDRFLKEAQSCHPGNGPGTKSMFKNFLVAVRKQSIKDILQDMAAHKESISLSLSTTGRSVEPKSSFLRELTNMH